jgi:hypothetical protein
MSREVNGTQRFGKAYCRSGVAALPALPQFSFQWRMQESNQKSAA